MSHNISTLTEEDRTGFEVSTMGKTGIAMRYYPYPEYKTLSDEQRQELSEWSRESRRRHPNLREKRKRNRAKISALQTELKELKEFKTKYEAQATIAAASLTTETQPRNNRINSALQRVTRTPTQNQVE